MDGANFTNAKKFNLVVDVSKDISAENRVLEQKVVQKLLDEEFFPANSPMALTVFGLKGDTHSKCSTDTLVPMDWDEQQAISAAVDPNRHYDSGSANLESAVAAGWHVQISDNGPSYIITNWHPQENQKSDKVAIDKAIEAAEVAKESHSVINVIALSGADNKALTTIANITGGSLVEATSFLTKTLSPAAQASLLPKKELDSIRPICDQMTKLLAAATDPATPIDSAIIASQLKPYLTGLEETTQRLKTYVSRRPESSCKELQNADASSPQAVQDLSDQIAILRKVVQERNFETIQTELIITQRLAQVIQESFANQLANLEDGVSAGTEAGRALRDRQYGEAIAHYSTAIEHDPSSAFNYLRRGQAEFYLSDYVRANVDFSRFICMHADVPDGYLWRAQTKLAQRDFTASETDISKYRDLCQSREQTSWGTSYHPNLATSYYLQGKARAGMDDNAAALNYYKQAECHGLDDTNLHTDISEAATKTGDYQQVLNNCDKVLQSEPGNAHLLELRNQAYEQLGKAAQAP